MFLDLEQLMRCIVSLEIRTNSIWKWLENIELNSFPNPPSRLSYPEACGLRHITFQVEDIEVAVRELISKGIEVEDIKIDETTNKRFTFFKDPDQLPIELYER